MIKRKDEFGEYQNVDIVTIFQNNITKREDYIIMLQDKIKEKKEEMLVMEEKGYFKAAMIRAQDLVGLYSEMDAFIKEKVIWKRTLNLIQEDKENS